MEGQHGYVPPTESKTENPQQPGYHQTGFQPTNDESSKGFQQTGFQPTNTGYQPLPAQQKTTISAEKFSEIEQAVKAAKAALDKVNDLISNIAFTPQPSGGFD